MTWGAMEDRLRRYDKDISMLKRIVNRRPKVDVAIPPLPAPQVSSGVASPAALTSTTFEDVPSVAPIVVNNSEPLYARIDMQCIISDNAAVYTMLGATVSGATTLSEVENGLTTDFSGFTPFGYSSGQLFGSKIVLLNAGTNTITLRRRRNGTTGTNITNYAVLTVTPIAWADTPGPIADDSGWIELLLLNSFTAGNPAPAIRLKNGVVWLRGILYRSSAPSMFTSAFAIPNPPAPGNQFRYAGRDDLSVHYAITTADVQVKASSAAPSGIGYALDGISWIPAGM